MKLLMKSYESVAHFKKKKCASFSCYTRLPLNGDVTIVLCFSPRKTGPIFSSPILGVWMDHHHPVHDGSLPQDALPLHALLHLRWGTRGKKGSRVDWWKKICISNFHTFFEVFLFVCDVWTLAKCKARTSLHCWHWPQEVAMYWSDQGIILNWNEQLKIKTLMFRHWTLTMG